MFVSVPTSAVYVFTRDKLRAVGCTSTFSEDVRAALRAWASYRGRSCAVVLETAERWIAALTWAENDYEAAVWDFHRQCELFAVAWAPAHHSGPVH